MGGKLFASVNKLSLNERFNRMTPISISIREKGYIRRFKLCNLRFGNKTLTNLKCSGYASKKLCWFVYKYYSPLSSQFAWKHTMNNDLIFIRFLLTNVQNTIRIIKDAWIYV